MILSRLKPLLQNLIFKCSGGIYARLREGINPSPTLESGAPSPLAGEGRDEG